MKKYLITYFSVIFIIVSLLLLSALIPRKSIEKNYINSTNNFRLNAIYNWMVTDYGDYDYLEISYAMDNEHPIKGIIYMNSKMSRYLDPNSSEQYARYVHGPVMYIRPLLLITNYNGIKFINMIVFISILLILLIKLIKIDKVFTIAFIITFTSLSLFFVPNNISYCNCVLLGMIGSIFIINMYNKKSKKYGLLFMVLGVLTNVFDFFTIESMSLVMPLFIYVFLHIKDDKKIKIIDIIKYILIWFIAYSSIYIIKWFIAYLFLGKDFIYQLLYLHEEEVFNISNPINFLSALDKNLSLMIPFCFMKNYIPYLICLLILFSFIFIKYVDKRKYIGIYLIMIIPIIRFIFVYIQWYRFPFTTFRTLFPIVLFINYIFVKYINECLKKQK